MYFPKGSIKIGTTDFTTEVSSAVLTPTAPSSAFTDIGGKTTNSVGDPNWAMALTIGQDVKDDDALSLYLIEHHGEVEEVVYTPQEGGRAFTIDAVMIAGAIGGAGGSQATSQVTLPCEGQPTITPAA